MIRLRTLTVCAFIGVALYAPALSWAKDFPPEMPIIADTIYWSDADSGKIAGIPFRLSNVDAPETRSLKQRGGAKCESERRLGYAAKAFMVTATKGKTLTIENHHGFDKYGRLVVDLKADEIDVSVLGLKAGHLAPWPHVKGRAQAKKPDWCDE